MTSLEKDNGSEFRARALVLFGFALVLIASACRDARAAVSLTKFEAAAQADGSILVTWETATELECHRFQALSGGVGHGALGSVC